VGYSVILPAVTRSSGTATKHYNVLALPSGTVPSDARVILSTHFDTVPVASDNPRTSQNRLYGRGTTDAKGILPSMLVAARELTTLDPDGASRGLALLFVCGEETDHAGMIAANSVGFDPSLSIVNGEPTTGRLCVKQKGMLKVRLDATDSGYPELGASAIDALLDVLAAIRSHSWPVDPTSFAETTVNIGVISGGTAPNVVADAVSATLLFRLVTDVEPVLAVIRTFIDAVNNVTSTVVTQNAPQHMYTPSRAAATFGTYTASYNTDLVLLQQFEQEDFVWRRDDCQCAYRRRVYRR
jgi:acetylornithine deacetylase